MFLKDDVDFIAGRLNNSIVSYNNEPVSVGKVYKDKKGDVLADILDLNDTPYSGVDIDQLDCRPVKLGFINFTTSDCRYLSRIPHRAWRQGMTVDNTLNYGIDLWRYRLNLRDTILGNYPTFAVANTKKYFTAFHRDFAVKKNLILYKDIGIIGELGKLDPRFTYLDEYLQEAVG